MQAPRHSSFNSHAGGALHAKEEVGWGEGAQRMAQCRGTWKWGTVVAEPEIQGR